MAREIVITLHVEEDEPLDIEDEALSDIESDAQDTLTDYGYHVLRG